MNKFFENLGRILGGERTLRAIGRSTDLFLAAFIILLIMIIIVPISPGVLDNFIAINLTISISLLMVALYIPKAVNLSIFPSLLLITTLFRFGIEISATKQILLYANAGHIIYAFGQFVVGGNFVVGGIVFLIITIVQFIVVTKGAERVAEVAARFTLDAMPGKQMSIDADMRSGVIDANQARELRLALPKREPAVWSDGRRDEIRQRGRDRRYRHCGDQHHRRSDHRDVHAWHDRDAGGPNLYPPLDRRRPRLPNPLTPHRPDCRYRHDPRLERQERCEPRLTKSPPSSSASQKRSSSPASSSWRWPSSKASPPSSSSS